MNKFQHEIIVSSDKQWIAEITIENMIKTVTNIQPVGGNYSISFYGDFQSFKNFINTLCDIVSKTNP